MRPSIVRSLALVLVLLYAQAASAATGRTPGTFAVSNMTGAATYSIPIWAPPGPHGLQPHIALVYSSQAGNGPEGVGWSIAGLSQITRCNGTYAQDTAPAAVTLTYADRFCLDGNRLRLTSSENLSTYGQSGTTYQTEIANFANVTAEGTTGSGPSYFEVQGKDGKTYEYGNGGNSQIVLNGTAATWLLDKVTDRAGNTMTIAYACATGQSCSNPSSALVGDTVPVTISWTPSSHGSSSYNYTMTFSYQPTAAALAAGYVAGNQTALSDLLFGIDIQSSGTTVKNYVFAYSTSPTTNRLTLSSVQECADAGASNCLLPTNLQYQGGTAGVVNPTTASASGATNGHINAVDLNGDGRADLVFATTNGSGNYQWWVQFATASGYGAPVNTGAITSAGTSVLLDDFDASGTNEILAPNGSTWYAYKWNGSTFVATSTGIVVVSGAVYSSADVNGDGLPDLVYVYANFDFNLHVQLNTTSGSAISFAPTAVVTSIPGEPSCDPPYQPCPTYPALQLMGNNQMPNSAVKSFDFDGDGRQDLILTYTSSFKGSISYEIITLLSRGTGPFVEGTVNGNGLGQEPVLAVNWNDDACTDLVIGTSLMLSKCNGGVSSLVTLPASPFLALDWDGDGLTDLIVYSGGNYYLYHSTASSYSDSLINSFSVGSGPVLVMDQNGDGLSDVAYASTSSSFAISYGLHNGSGTPPDLLSNVTDGYGNSASVTYGPITQSNYMPYGTPAYPYAPYLVPIYVVNKATYSDPSAASGTYYQTFIYTNSEINLQGRPWTGFSHGQTFDSRTGLYENLYQDVTFPGSGLPSVGDDLGQTSDPPWPNELVRSTYCNEAFTTLDSTANNQRYFPHCGSVGTAIYELGGSENEDLISQSTTTYAYDNFGNATSIATTVTDHDPGSPYSGDSWTITTTNTTDVDTTHWCLGLFTQQVVAYTGTVGTSVTRTKSLTPDTTNCRYTQIITEPSSSTYEATEALGYDAFGNINTDTVTGINMTARTTTINWTNSTVTTGQFPMNVTDPSGAQTQFGYNLSYGLISSMTDPNGETTSWQYADGFGRKTQETRPDGTFTNWTYEDCASSGGCFFGPHALALVFDNYNSDSSLQFDGTIRFDQVDRPLIIDKRMMSGSYDRNEVRYDSLGNIAQQAAPCVWTAVTTACPYFTTYSHDAINRLIQVTRPISSTNSNPQTTIYQYVGQTTIITDPNSITTSTIRDVNGWLRQTRDAYSYIVTLSYDAAGSKTGMSDSESHALWAGTYSYGIAPFNVTASDVDLGSWSYTFDALGDVTGWTDAKGQSFSESYDALSRPLKRYEPDYFTQWTWGSTPASHNVGRLASVCTGVGTSPTLCTSGYAETETYDSLARLSQRSIAIPGDSTLNYTYAYGATTGLLSTLTYPVTTSGYALKLQYGYSAGMLQSVTDVSDAPNVALWTNNAMNPDGTISKETAGNGVVTTRTYDAVTHWLGAVTAGIGGGTGLENQSYLYGLTGAVTQRQNNTLGLTENFYYDNDYRLSSSKLNSVQNLSVGYDLNGNITSRSDLAGGAAWTYSPTRYHEVTQAGSSAYTYSYDANGNGITRNGSTVNWTSYNYPSSISASDASGTETVAFVYGPDRSRWQQNYNSGTEVTNYIGGLLEQVAAGGITTWRHYVYAGSERVAVYSRTSTLVNTWSYFLSDHLGSIAGITNASGAVEVNESFTAFGARRNPSSWSGAPSSGDLTTIAGLTRQGYTFQTVLGQSMGLNHLNGRVQDAITGRFLSADPNIPDPTNTQDYNRYSYVDNNPLTLVDPTGFSSECDAECSGGGSIIFDVNSVSSLNPANQGAGSQVTLAGSNLVLPPLIIPAQLPTYCEEFAFSSACQSVFSDPGIPTPTGEPASEPAPPAQGAPQLPEVKVTAKRSPQTTQCGPTSSWPHGGGISAGGSLELGLPGLAGAAGQVSTGVGAFHGTNTGWSGGTFDTGGATAYFGGSAVGAPKQSSPGVLGASVGGGAFAFITNAQSVQQLGGPFSSYSFNLGFGPAQFSVNLATGGGIWALSVSPPFAGVTFLGSASKITTNTTTSGGGCH